MLGGAAPVDHQERMAFKADLPHLEQRADAGNHRVAPGDGPRRWWLAAAWTGSSTGRQARGTAGRCSGLECALSLPGAIHRRSGEVRSAEPVPGRMPGDGQDHPGQAPGRSRHGRDRGPDDLHGASGKAGQGRTGGRSGPPLSTRSIVKTTVELRPFKTKLLEGLTILYRLQPGAMPQVLSLTGRQLRQQEYDSISQQSFLPRLTTILPRQPAGVGDTWPVSSQSRPGLCLASPPSEEGLRPDRRDPGGPQEHAGNLHDRCHRSQGTVRGPQGPAGSTP